MNNEVKMEQTNKLVPELRFPEFVNDGEWIEDKLGEIAEIKGRIGYRGYTVADIVSKGKGAITLSPSNFYDNGTLDFEKCTYITWEKYEESPEIQLEEGQTVLVKTASVGKSAYVEKLPEKATINPQIVVLKPKKIHNKFLSYTILHDNIQNQIKSCVGAGAIPNLSQDSISKFKILLPSDSEVIEQQKIADCLTSLDELITAHNDKLEALKNHKKALLQNLFPQDGQKVPNYRFPEFVNDGEWETTTVANNCNVKGRIGFRGYTKEDLVSKEKGVFVIGGKHIQNQMLDLSDPTYLSWDKYYESPEIMVELNDIVFSQRGTLGDCAIIDVKIGEATINPSMVLLKKIKCNPRFLYYILIGEKIQNEVAKSRTSAAIPMLSQKQIKEFSFYIPNPKEQQRIADCLMAVDSLITAQTEKIEQLKAHKKGLMQGLFPKID